MTTKDTTSGFRPPHRLVSGPVLSLVASAALVGWMASTPPPSPGEGGSAAADTPATKARPVRVVASVAQPYRRTITLRGDTLPLRRATAAPGIGGTVARMLVAEGDRVSEGQAVAELSVPDLDIRRAEAQARLAEAQRSFDAARSLADRNIATGERLASARSALATAEASLARIDTELGDTTVRAPIAGTVNTVAVEVGERVKPGDAILETVDLSRLVAGVSIPEKDLPDVAPGQEARVVLATGQEATGRVTFIAPLANTQTRTFKLEIEIPNRDRRLRGGVTATVELRGRPRDLHAVSVAHLSLSESEELLVKTVEEGKVRSRVVRIVGFGDAGAFVSGLPDRADIITVGQGFVRDGDPVAPSFAEPS